MTLTRLGGGVSEVRLSRPSALNAFSRASFAELLAVLERVADDPQTRAIVLSGEGPAFSVGLDLKDHAEMLSVAPGGGDPARRGLMLRRRIAQYQRAISALEACPQPVVAAIHGACIGAGVDLVAAADVRVASQCAMFSIREVRLGLAADLSTLQRLPRLVGNASALNELVFTGRDFGAAEALALGAISGPVEADAAAVRERALALARCIAQLSPVAVAGTKANLLFARDAGTAASLEYAAAWSGFALQSADIAANVAAFSSRKAATSPSTPPVFEDLK